MLPPIELPNRFPLYSPLSTRSGDVPLTKDCRLINGFVEFDPADKQYWIYKRPGLAVNANYTFAADNGPQIGRGIYQAPSWATNVFSLVSVFGSEVFVGGGSAGPVDDVAGKFTFESVTLALGIGGSILTTAVVLNDTYKQYLLTRHNIGYNLTEITPPLSAGITTAFSMAPGWAFLDGTLYCMDILGNIFGSNLSDPTTWNPLNVVAASSNADLGVAIAKHGTYVVALKQYTTQIFFNNSNPAPGSPLSPVPDSQIPLGCYAAYSVQQMDNTLLWLSANESASPQLVQMDNLVPGIVSTPNVERLLKGFTNGASPLNMQNDTFSWVFKLDGHRFYVLTSLSLNLTLVYDLDQKAWYIWTDPAGNAFPVVGTSYQGAVRGGVGGPLLVQSTTDGNVYTFSSADIAPNDLGQLAPVDIYTPNFDAGVDKIKLLSVLRFNADQIDGSVLNVRYNDNDYDVEGWSNFRNVDLSQNRPYIDNEGSFYSRAYHLRHMCNTSLRIKSGDLLLGLGSL